MFANAAAQELIESFHVDHKADIPVHDILTITFKGDLAHTKYQAVALPGSIHEVYLDQCKAAYGQSNIDKAKSLRSTSGNESSSFIP